MPTLTAIGNRLRRLSQDLAFSVGQSHSVRVWAGCRHCGTKTRQVARPVNGYYHCLQCGEDPNASSVPESADPDPAVAVR